MSKLRSYAPLRRQSEKVKAGAGAFAAVYRQVDERSEGRCEVSGEVGPWRCPRRGVEHHHLFKPRRANHTAEQVIHVCRACHDRTEWPFVRGRLCFAGRLGPLFLFIVRYSSDKFTNRGQGHGGR